MMHHPTCVVSLCSITKIFITIITFFWTWSFSYVFHLFVSWCFCVTTLALGSWPRQGLTRVRAKKRIWEYGRMWEWTLTLPKWTSIMGTSKSDCKGKNPSPWGVLYIIGKLLKCRCPKWARMTHLDICNTSYGQKKGHESNWQFNSRPRKVGNRPDSFTCRWCVTCRWKALDEGYNFSLDPIPIGGLHKKL